MFDLIINNKDIFTHFLSCLNDFDNILLLKRLNIHCYNFIKKNKIINTNYKNLKKEYVLRKIYKTLLYEYLKSLKLTLLNNSDYRDHFIHMTLNKDSSTFSKVTKKVDESFAILRSFDSFLCLDVYPDDKNIKNYHLYFGKDKCDKIPKCWTTPLPIFCIPYTELVLYLKDEKGNKIKNWNITYNFYFYPTDIRDYIMYDLIGDKFIRFFFGPKKKYIYALYNGSFVKVYSK